MNSKNKALEPTKCSETATIILKLIAEKSDLHVTALTADQKLQHDLGWDSLTMAEFAMELEEILDEEIPDSILESVQTVGQALETADRMEEERE